MKLIMNFNLPFTLDFNLKNGLSNNYKSTQRKLSNMKNIFFDTESYNKEVEIQDKIIYEFYELDAPVDSGDIAFGTSIVYPGKIGNEYFMTKGHFHTIMNTGEVYYCISGTGVMLMENKAGNVVTEILKPGIAVYCSKGYAHRSINTGNSPLVTFFSFRADAGHDYGTIETKGFRKLLVDDDGIPRLIDNPLWRE